jgi:hypothetical protein
MAQVTLERRHQVVALLPIHKSILVPLVYQKETLLVFG